MTSANVYRRALAYRNDRSERHHQGLDQAALQLFWSLVLRLRFGASSRAVAMMLADHDGNVVRHAAPPESSDVRDVFWRDQRAAGEPLPQELR